MTNINIKNFKEKISEMLKQTIKYNEPININTEEGNAVVMSEEEYRGVMETLYLLSTPEMKKKLLEGKKTPLSECIPESEVDW